MAVNLHDFKLCYVSGPWAWFTTAPLDKQWGDDWDDRPYEHNAGDPYGWREGDGEPYRLMRVAYDGPFIEPRYGHWNSPFSVREINAGAIAWLLEKYRDDDRAPFVAPAGLSFPEFVTRVRIAGGEVYTPVWREVGDA